VISEAKPPSPGGRSRLPVSSPETCPPPFSATALVPVKKTTVGVPPSGAAGEAAVITNW